MMTQSKEILAEPIRIAMIIQSYYPRLGGAERQLAAIVRRLEGQGYEFHILTRRYPGMKACELVDGVPVYRLPAFGPKILAGIVFRLSAFFTLWRVRPDLIHAHELLSPSYIAVFARRLFGVPVVAKVLRGGELGDIDKLQRKPFGKWRITLFRRYIDRFIVISREIDDELAHIGVPPDQRTRIPNGVDVEKFAPLSDDERQKLRSSLGFSSNLITIYSGRLEAEKRVNLLIDIWPQIRADHPDAILIVLGSGTQETDLKRIAGDGIYFIGQVDDVVPYLQIADLFVLPSITEGLSNALLEAMAVGLPVIVTDVGGASDVVEHGVSGLLAFPDDPSQLRELIFKVLGDAQFRLLLGCQARLRIADDFALTSTLDRLMSLYKQIARKN
jgi:glycosyltransferase involved in cell wall biosynthesis